MPVSEGRARLLRGAGEVLLQLMCDRASANQWEEWLAAPLEHAAGAANFDLVDKLLRAGATGVTGWRGCRGKILLHAGAEGGDAQVVRRLIRAGAGEDKDAKNANDSTPLHLAVAGNKEAVAKALIMAGADVNMRDANGDAPLHLAINNGNGGLADTLLLCGADPSANDRKGEYPIHRAAYHGLDDAVLALAQKGVCLNSLDAGERTLLCIAVLQENLSTMRVLLAEGASANFAFGAQKACTVLHLAAEFNKPNAILALIDAGANVEARAKKRRTPLHHAARHGSCAAMLSLLQRGADVNAEGRGSLCTPLHIACSKGKADAADLLLRWGADETALTFSGNPPGSSIPKIADAPDRVRPRLERLSKLLKHAPQDRSWRRRGFLVMCRAHRGRLRLRVEVPDGAAETTDQPPEPPSRRPRRGHVKVEVRVGGARGGRGGGSGSSAHAQRRAGRDGTGGGFDGVAAWLMAVPDAKLFRNIVRFL